MAAMHLVSLSLSFPYWAKMEVDDDGDTPYSYKFHFLSFFPRQANFKLHLSLSLIKSAETPPYHLNFEISNNVLEDSNSLQGVYKFI
ncbi:hypothetical protein HanIR_Chr01g0033831 [Helianthus annuus]|nr:hypothetical protein HanIR_Chr01g0033831 [Helianthus annuus]